MSPHTHFSSLFLSHALTHPQDSPSFSIFLLLHHHQLLQQQKSGSSRWLVAGGGGRLWPREARSNNLETDPRSELRLRKSFGCRKCHLPDGQAMFNYSGGKYLVKQPGFETRTCNGIKVQIPAPMHPVSWEWLGRLIKRIVISIRLSLWFTGTSCSARLLYTLLIYHFQNPAMKNMYFHLLTDL